MKTIGRDFGDVARKVYATASGTLPNGKPVIVNTDGTVSIITETSATQALGSPVVFSSVNSTYVAGAFDSANNRVVFSYRGGNSGYGYAVVGTVSGNSISFGTPVVFESASVYYVGATFDINASKVVIAYRSDSGGGKGKAIVGTVSGTTISFGNSTIFEAVTANFCRITFDSNSNKVVVAYSDSGNSAYGTAAVGTVSGTSISFGTPVVFESASSADTAITFDSNSNKVVIAYKDVGNSNYGTAIVGTVSGTGISFGTAVVFESAAILKPAITFDSNSNKVVIAYTDGGNNNYGTSVVGTVSGTGISFGTAVVFNAADTTQATGCVFDSTANKVVIAYKDAGNSNYSTLIVGAVSGTGISFGSEVVFDQKPSGFYLPVFDSTSNKVVIGYEDANAQGYGRSVVFQNAFTSTTLTAENYIGMTPSAYPSGAGAEIDTKGAINTEQSSLTAGQSYFVQTNGTIGTTAADPSVFAGTAVSATKLIVKG